MFLTFPYIMAPYQISRRQSLVRGCVDLIQSIASLEVSTNSFSVCVVYQNSENGRLFQYQFNWSIQTD